MVGQMAYFWGWPLMANANRAAAFSKAPEPGLVGGEIPIAYGGIAMLTDYITPLQEGHRLCEPGRRVWPRLPAAG